MDQLINKGKNILKSTISYDVLYAKDGYSILPVSIKHLSIRLPKSWEVFISPDLVIEQARNNGWCIVEGEDDFLKVLAQKYRIDIEGFSTYTSIPKIDNPWSAEPDNVTCIDFVWPEYQKQSFISLQMIIAGMISQLDINELKSFFNGEKDMQATFTELSEYLIKKFVDELTIEEIEGIRNLVKQQIIIDMDLRRKLDNK